MHLAQVDGESPKANYFGVGVGIEKVLFDPDADSDPDPDPIHWTEVYNQVKLFVWKWTQFTYGDRDL